MVFIVGGAYQGKSEYVKKYINDGYQIIYDYHLIVKEQLNNGKNPIDELERLLENLNDRLDRVVVISDELGSGLVPMGKELREYREMSGRVNCILAKRADEVIRVICGIGTKIK